MYVEIRLDKELSRKHRRQNDLELGIQPPVQAAEVVSRARIVVDAWSSILAATYRFREHASLWA